MRKLVYIFGSLILLFALCSNSFARKKDSRKNHEEEVLCPNCQTSGKEVCEICNGIGHIQNDSTDTVCSACGGTGFVTCSACGGFRVGALADCYACNSKGKTKCIDCKGNGFIEDHVYWETCNTCHGRSEILCPTCHGASLPREKCTYCDNGKIKCDKCGGKKITNYIEAKCEKCSSKGYIKCKKCNGKGYFYPKCPTCNGSRHFKCPNNCVNGKIRHATGHDCERCNGKGKLDCDYCYGSGKIFTQILNPNESFKCVWAIRWQHGNTEVLNDLMKKKQKTLIGYDHIKFDDRILEKNTPYQYSASKPIRNGNAYYTCIFSKDYDKMLYRCAYVVSPNDVEIVYCYYDKNSKAKAFQKAEDFEKQWDGIFDSEEFLLPGDPKLESLITIMPYCDPCIKGYKLIGTKGDYNSSGLVIKNGRVRELHGGRHSNPSNGMYDYRVTSKTHEIEYTDSSFKKLCKTTSWWSRHKDGDPCKPFMGVPNDVEKTTSTTNYNLRLRKLSDIHYLIKMGIKGTFAIITFDNNFFQMEFPDSADLRNVRIEMDSNGFPTKITNNTGSRGKSTEYYQYRDIDKKGNWKTRDLLENGVPIQTYTREL